VVAADRSANAVREAAREGALPAASVADAVAILSPPRVVWLMVPAGPPVDENVELLAGTLKAGDVVVDGGNSLYKEAPRRAKRLAESGVRFLDAGTSGGIWGLAEGYCLMVGGDEDAFRVVNPILATLAPPGGYAYMGPHGAGHFVKMVHNGIEYGMMQSYAEGFELLSSAPFSLDLRAIASLWNQGSVVRSWLLELAERALEKDPGLSGLSPYVEDSGEGRWTVERSIEAGVPLPSIALSLYMRFFSRQDNSFAMRMLAALRNEFGGHAVKTASARPKKGKRND
jgi:6-phosphogluconate dehydrogenase